jgi:hypothetical protein
MILHTHALLGEILAFRLGRETILLRTGWTQFDEEKTEQIYQVITCHIDFVLQGLSQRSLDHEKTRHHRSVDLLLIAALAAAGGGIRAASKGLTLYGNVDIRTVNMSFRVGGRLASLNVDEGDKIQAGQTLGSWIAPL